MTITQMAIITAVIMLGLVFMVVRELKTTKRRCKVCNDELTPYDKEYCSLCDYNGVDL